MRLATQEQAAAEAAAEAKAEAEAALEMARLQAEDKESVLLDIVVLYSDDGYVDPPPGYWKVPYDLNKVLQTRLLFSFLFSAFSSTCASPLMPSFPGRQGAGGNFVYLATKTCSRQVRPSLKLPPFSRLIFSRFLLGF